MARLEESNYKTRLRSKGQITLPKGVRDLLNLKHGDDLIFSVNDEGQVVIERLQVVPPDQAWFWTKRWQQLERKAQEDIDAGRVHHYANVDEAIGALQELEDAGDSMD